jgi:hypothetical protein
MPENPPQTPDEEREQRVEERAERLAEHVEEQATAQTARVEERAEKLAEHQAEERVGHRVEERADQRADVKSELVEITEAIGTLINRMDTNIPADKVQSVLDAALSEERRDRKRMKNTLLGAVLVAIAFGGGGWLQSRDNGQGIIAAKKVASYVENCLQHPEKLSIEQKKEQCGAASASGQAGFVNYLNCAFLIMPEDRTEQLLKKCASDAFQSR